MKKKERLFYVHDPVYGGTMPDMTIGHPTSPLTRRRLGSFLRRLRENHDPKILSKDAAKAVGIFPGPLGQIERGEYKIRMEWLRILLDLYEVKDEVTRTALMDAVMERPEDAWWWPYRKKLSGAYLDSIALESTAKKIHTQSAGNIPGLVQCASYAIATQKSSLDPSTRSNADLYFSIRMSRQQVIQRPDDPVHLHAFIPETAFLTRLPMLQQTLSDQAKYLISLSKRDNITIQVMTLDAPTGFWSWQSSSLFTCVKPWPKVVHTEDPFGGFSSEDPVKVKFSELRFAQMEEVALTEEQSREFLSQYEEKSA